jgi:hypothetical protein
MPKSKKKVTVRDQAPSKDPKGGHNHKPKGGGAGFPGSGPGHPIP